MLGITEVMSEELRKKKMIKWHNNMLDLKPNDTGLLYAKGAILAKVEEYEEALKTFDKVICLDPAHIKAWDTKAKTLFKMGRYEEALSCYNKLIELEPQNETYWYGKGETLCKLERYREALDCYTYAIDLYPNYTEARIGRSHALKELKSPKRFLKRMKIKPEDLDRLDKKIILVLSNGNRTVPEICRGLGIPTSVIYPKVLRLEALGVLECIGKVLIPNTIKKINVYRCSDKVSILAKDQGMKIEKMSEEKVAAV